MVFKMKKFKIEKNSVQETLMIPLMGRVIAQRKFPNLINDPTAEEIIKKIDYDFSSQEKKMTSIFGVYGALEVSQREYDLEWEIKDYLKSNPKASVVNLGCGLDDLFNRVNNGECRGFNIDFEDVITARNELLPPLENEKNIIHNINDTEWFSEIPHENGVIFVGLGLFYYFTFDEVKSLFTKMTEHFTTGVIAFDITNKRGLKLMLKTLVKDSAISDIDSYFHIKDVNELNSWTNNFKRVSSKSYMNGYRKLDDINIIYKLLNKLSDSYVGMKIVKIGDPLPHTQDRNTVPTIEGTTTVFPIRDDGLEMNWGVTRETLKRLIDNHVVQISPNKNSQYQPYTIKYLSENYQEKIASGRWAVRGYREDGSKIVVETGGKVTRATTVWKETRYDAKTYGTVLLKNIIGDARFSFPKSLYSVADTLRYFVMDKPDALIIDFFAGSGTTLHAVNLLNAEDGGHRRCVIVTNNEVSDTEAKEMTKRGLKPGDEEWEALGIARYVTWPRTVCAIEGHDVNGNPLKGNYLGSDIPMSDGFNSNAIYFKLGFLDKTAVALGMQFKEMLPVLWMKAGAIGKCPEVIGTVPDMLILPGNRFAVLINENAFAAFEEAVNNTPEIQTVFIVTDYEVNYRAMIKNLTVEASYQLYRDYLDNFRINHGRN